MLRVVSLVPSVTETLVAWGVPPIARTRFCDLPAAPAVGGTKDPDVATIAALAPDLVVMDEEENRREDFAALGERDVPTLALAVRDIADVGPALSTLAARLGVDYRPSAIGPPSPVQRTAFVPIWRRPWMALGTPTYGASLLRHLGVATVPADAGPYPTVELADLTRIRPDVVLAPSEPYPFTERQRGELETVAPTHFVDGRDLFWWGTRTPDAVARLAGAAAAW